MFQVVFEAKRGLTSSCDTALDNIKITEGACPGKFTEQNTKKQTNKHDHIFQTC